MRQPRALETSFDRESGGKLGDLASIFSGWPISNLNATHLQMHLAGCWDANLTRFVGNRVGFGGPCRRQWRPIDILGNHAMSAAKIPPLPSTFNRLAWSNLAAQSAEQIALAAAPTVAVLLLRLGEGH